MTQTNKNVRQRIYNTAVRMLAAREHSTSELKQKLTRKYKDSEAVSSVVEELLDQGLVDDNRFIKVLVHSRINKGYGPFYIQQEMRSKGVDPRQAERLEEWCNTDWLALASDLFKRRFDLESCTKDLKSWQKAMRYFQRRGFPGKVVYDVLPDMPK